VSYTRGSRLREASVVLADLPKGKPQRLPAFRGNPSLAAVKRAIKSVAKDKGYIVKIISVSSKEHYIWRVL
jgi:hypothetical protein